MGLWRIKGKKGRGLKNFGGGGKGGGIFLAPKTPSKKNFFRPKKPPGIKNFPVLIKRPLGKIFSRGAAPPPFFLGLF